MVVVEAVMMVVALTKMVKMEVLAAAEQAMPQRLIGAQEILHQLHHYKVIEVVMEELGLLVVLLAVAGLAI
jgi:hypothetical protein